jgi:CubicO group peptidase (beta-lactamase class C family)
VSPSLNLAPQTPSPLFQAFEHQDDIFAPAFEILRESIAQRAFPAASVAVTHQERLVALKSLGHFTYETNAEGAPSLSRSSRRGGNFEVSPSTLFDLASLTKVVATTTASAILYERGLLELEAPVIGVVPEFMADSCDEPDPHRRDVTFRMLLAHSSGLPAYEKLFLKAHSRDDLLRAAFTTSLSTAPSTHAEYSDIGFIVLGTALERIAGESLDIFCHREIFGPLAMTYTTFNPPEETRPQIPPTADERQDERCGAGTPAREMRPENSPPSVSPQARGTLRNKIIQGEVQDENAYILGGVAPHAGLFSTAQDLARFAHATLHDGRPILRPETVALFTRREPAPLGTSRALGWDTPSAPSQSGKYFGPRSFGHLGYTGTSLWIDPDRQLSITLLTNRTWPDYANQAIKQVRPMFHDAIIEALSNQR